MHSLIFFITATLFQRVFILPTPFYMKAHLVRKELWGVILGDVPWPIGSTHHKIIAAWEKKHSIAAAKIIIHVSPKYITHCDDSDVIGTWNKLRMLFHTKGHSSAAALWHQFNSIWYDPDMSMQDWITKVEEWAWHLHLEDIKSPMIPINIINTLTHDLPDSCSICGFHQFTTWWPKLCSQSCDCSGSHQMLTEWGSPASWGKSCWHWPVCPPCQGSQETYHML